MVGTQPGQCAALRVLLVEDHADTAWSLASLLRIWGHEVMVASSGQTAVWAAKVFAPDVALLDDSIRRMAENQARPRCSAATCGVEDLHERAAGIIAL
jgi:CheY-like chemotaxis protein